MKKTVAFLAGVFLAVTVGAVASACAADPEEHYDVWLQRYEEQEIQISDGAFSDYEWTSSDESAVTAENGKLIAHKTSKDPVTITGKGKKKTIIITVKKVNDTAGKPKILQNDFTAYVGIEKELSPKIMYNGKQADVTSLSLTYSVSAEDSALIKADGLKITGTAVGETTILLQTQYKGLTIKGEASVTVKPATYLEMKKREYNLIFTDNAKINSAVIEAEACVNGELLETPAISYRVIDGDETCFKIENGKAIALKEGSATVRAELTGAGNAENAENASAEFVVNVLPPYKTEVFTIADVTQPITYAPYTGAVGGRSPEDTLSGITYYYTEKFALSSEGWNDIWPRRILNGEIGGNLIESYRNGYRYFTFDIYLPAASELRLGFTHGGTDYAIPYDKFFYSSWIQILDENGKLFNRVKEQKWLTISIDLYAMILEYPSATLSIYYAPQIAEQNIYFSNICYRYDGTFMADKKLSYESKDGYIQADNAEFHSTSVSETPVYAPAEEETIGGVTGSYKFTGRAGGYDKNTLAALSSLGTSRGDSLTRLAERGKYLTFDLYISRANSVRFSILSGEKKFLATVGVSDFSKCDWIDIVRGGKLQYTIESDSWQTVSINYEKACLYASQLANAPVSIELALAGNGDAAYINNVRYYKDGDFLPSAYENFPPSGIEAADENAELSNVVSGEYKGSTLYENKNGEGKVIFGEVQRGTTPGTFFSEQNKFITLSFCLTDGAKTLEISSLTQISGYTIHNASTVIVGEPYEKDGNLLIFDINGSEVNEIETGKWYILSFYVEYMALPASANVTFAVIGENGGAASAYLKDLSLTKQPVYGEELPEPEFMPGWINASGDESSVVLVRKEGEFKGAYRYFNLAQNDFSGVSFAAVKNGSFFEQSKKFLNFDFYLTSDVSEIALNSWITSPSVKDTSFAQRIKVGSVFSHTDRIYFFNAKGESVNRVRAGQWYTASMELNYPTSPDWRFVLFRTIGANGSAAYLKNCTSTMNLPHEWKDFEPIVADPLGFIAGSATITDATKDGVQVKKIEAKDGAGVYFKDVIDKDGNAGDFFASGYEFVTFDMYVESCSAFLFNTSKLNIWTNADGYEWKNNAGNEYGSQGYYLRSYTQDSRREPLKKGAWYTVSMRVYEWSVEASISASGGAATYYLKNLRFGKSFPQEKLPDAVEGLVQRSSDLTLAKVVSGDFENSVKITATGGGEWTNIIIFEGLYKVDGESEFSKGNYTKVCFEIYFETGSALAFGGKDGNCWWSSFGHAPNPSFSPWMEVKNASGESVTTVTIGAWYTVEIKGGDETNTYFGIGNGGAAYVRNLHFA